MAQIDSHLKKKIYSFWRFCHIFFHSGARETELLKVQKFHVDLANQRYKVIIKKGRSQSEVWKTIKNIALSLWQEILDQANENDFLFSNELVPGLKSIRPDQITRRWKRHVKDDLHITVDFYSLKHLNTTEIVNILGEQSAANLNSRTSIAMIKISELVTNYI